MSMNLYPCKTFSITYGTGCLKSSQMTDFAFLVDSCTDEYDVSDDGMDFDIPVEEYDNLIQCVRIMSNEDYDKDFPSLPKKSTMLAILVGFYEEAAKDDDYIHLRWF